VQFKRQTVSLDDVDIAKQPILYMTGLREFKLNEKEVKHLGDYLNAGGILFAESAMGSEQFELSFRAMVQSALPGTKFEDLRRSIRFSTTFSSCSRCITRRW